MLRSSEIINPQHDRTRRKGQCVTQRNRVIDRASLVDGAFGGAHRRIRKSLEPKYPRKYGACYHALVELKTNRFMGSLVGYDEIGEHVFGVPARAGLITQKV